MTKEHYLISSYFLVGLASLCLGAVVYCLLRSPLAAIAERATGRFGNRTLTRMLAVSMTIAAVGGFLSVSYTQEGCRSYEQIVKDRDYLIQINQEQLQATSEWVVWAVLLWCAVVAVCLVAWRHAKAKRTTAGIDPE